MTHLPSLIIDLGVMLVVAGVMNLLCKRLKQPVVLGYILAGYLVGPQTSFLPTVVDVEGVKIWAEIGIIFFLFGLGLEFSFRKLMRVGRSALIAATFEMSAMILLGILAGKLLGWSTTNSVFLGAMVSISSTTIIIRAFEELKLKTRQFVSLVYGILIVEDLLAISLLAILSAFAIDQTLSLTVFSVSLIKLLVVLLSWFALGIVLVPAALNYFRQYLNEEALLILSIAMCFLMVIMATSLGFSPALGAFVTGSILAETKFRHRIETLISPIRNLFGAVFFVSVGMALDLMVIKEHFAAIVLISLVIILGKSCCITAGTLLSGTRLRHSIQTGLSMAQIGEFSFIIAGLGLSLHVMDLSMYSIIVLVSAITTFTTPYLIRSSDSICRYAEGIYPHSYEVKAPKRTGFNPYFLKSHAPKLLFNLSLIVTISLLSKQWLLPFLDRYFANSTLISWCIVMLISSPFIWGLMFAQPYQKDGVHSRPFLLFRVGLAIFVLVICGVQFVPWSVAILTAIVFTAGMPLILFMGSEPIYRFVEAQFKIQMASSSEDRQMVPSALAPWDAQLSSVEVTVHSPFLGKSLKEIQVKENFGLTIVMIKRGPQYIFAPDRDEVIWPHDRLYVVGSDTEIERAYLALNPEVEESDGDDHDWGKFHLFSIHLDKGSPYCFKTIRDSGIREKTKWLIVGIERAGERTLSPDSITVLQPNDLLWIVGEK